MTSYNFRYMAVVWNSPDASDARVLKTNKFCGKVMLFPSQDKAKEEAKSRGCKYCETILFAKNMQPFKNILSQNDITDEIWAKEDDTL
jgi:hypothetical protein